MVRGLGIFQEWFAAYATGRRQSAHTDTTGRSRLKLVRHFVGRGLLRIHHGWAPRSKWTGLGRRRPFDSAQGHRKHLNDVLRLSQLLAPATRIPLDKKIGDDMARFLAAVSADTSIDPKALQLGNVAVAELVARIAKAFEIELPQQVAT